MTPNIVKSEFKSALTLLAAAFIFAAGWTANGWRLNSQISQLTEKEAKASIARTERNLATVVAGQRRNDVLVADVAKSETLRDQNNQEKARAIRSKTTGRPCLDGTAVRLLNLPDNLKPGAISQAISEPVPADAGFATDTDVAEWANLCRRSYDTCRGRLQAIHDFYGADEMSDDVDRAQDREQEMRQDAFDEQARKSRHPIESAMNCIECGEPIPEGRRDAQSGVQTCIDCQNDIEEIERRQGWGLF